MKVIRAKSAGFCWGVERAVQVARDEAQGGKKTVYTDGPLIHNRQMMSALSSEDIREVGDYQSQSKLELSKKEDKESVVVVRAHGISPERRQYLKGLGLPFRDGTCPDVGIIAGKVKVHAERGYDIVIFGDPEHPEVIGLMGYAKGKSHVVRNVTELASLPPFKGGVALVSQSTMFTHEFKEVSRKLSEIYRKRQYWDRFRYHLRCDQGKAVRFGRSGPRRSGSNRGHWREALGKYQKACEACSGATKANLSY